MTIGQAATAAGIPASSIRYYEAMGIVPKAPRKNGVRQYGPEQVDELKALRLYRATGIPIRGLMAIGTQPSGTSSRAAVWAEVLRARIDALDLWVRDAKQARDLLEQVIACRCDGKRERCTVMRAADALESNLPLEEETHSGLKRGRCTSCNNSSRHDIEKARKQQSRVPR